METKKVDKNLKFKYLYRDDYVAQRDYIPNTIKELENTFGKGIYSARLEQYPAFFVGAGSGEGKTRLLYEIAKYYSVKEENTICLSISLNAEGINGSHFHTPTNIPGK